MSTMVLSGYLDSCPSIDAQRLSFPLPSPDTKLGVIRQQLADYTQLPPRSFKLVHAGAVMKDDNAPSEFCSPAPLVFSLASDHHCGLWKCYVYRRSRRWSAGASHILHLPSFFTSIPRIADSSQCMLLASCRSCRLPCNS